MLARTISISRPRDPPTSASQSTRMTDVSHCVQSTVPYLRNHSQEQTLIGHVYSFLFCFVLFCARRWRDGVLLLLPRME